MRARGLQTFPVLPKHAERAAASRAPDARQRDSRPVPAGERAHGRGRRRRFGGARRARERRVRAPLSIVRISFFLQVYI